MATKTTKAAKPAPTIEKDGFVIYRDTVDAAMEILTTREQRGDFITAINDFINGRPVDNYDPLVMACFHFNRRGIERNSRKYDRKKANQRARYEAEQQRKKEVQQMLAHIEEDLEKKEETEETEKHALRDICGHNTNSNTNTNTNTNTNSNTKEIYKDKSLSSTLIHAKEEVATLLEEREIFFKKNWFEQFWQLNEFTYRWKYDPVSAAVAYARIHPEALKNTAKNTPQPAAAPQIDRSKAYLENVKQAEDDFRARAASDAAAIWAEVRPLLQQRLPLRFAEHLAQVKPLTVRYLRYGMRMLFMEAPNSDVAAELQQEMVAQADFLKEHKISAFSIEEPAAGEAAKGKK